MENNYAIVKFTDGALELDVTADKDNDTVWLSLDQMAELFQRDKSTISRHIKNVFNERELNRNSVVAFFATTASDGKTYQVEYFDLDVIISVGYRVKSNRGTQFRKWASEILKDYLVQGYAANEKRLAVLGKVVDVQNRMLASALNIDTVELQDVIDRYTNALNTLDDYDHHKLTKPDGSATTYRLNYEESREIIDSMRFASESPLFGVEKEEGKLKGILEAVYQNVFGEEVYPTIEEKAAHLLYFIVKDHPFVDGCKRIAATLFLEFLNRNGKLLSDGKLVISNNTLVAMTLLTAESKPEEMEIIINVIMRLLKGDRYE